MEAHRSFKAGTGSPFDVAFLRDRLDDLEQALAAEVVGG
jgi:hypothetical protein